MPETIRITGLRETARAFKEMDRDAQKELRLALLEAARPVAEDFQGRLSKYQGASVSTIRPRAVQKGAFVTQGAKKVTGKRSDFGVLQMVHMLEPALADHYDEILKSADGVIALIARRNGF